MNNVFYVQIFFNYLKMFLIIFFYELFISFHLFEKQNLLKLLVCIIIFILYRIFILSYLLTYYQHVINDEIKKG